MKIYQLSHLPAVIKHITHSGARLQYEHLRTFITLILILVRGKADLLLNLPLSFSTAIVITVIVVVIIDYV